MIKNKYVISIYKIFTIRLYVNIDNPSAQKLYEKCEF